MVLARQVIMNQSSDVEGELSLIVVVIQKLVEHCLKLGRVLFSKSE